MFTDRANCKQEAIGTMAGVETGFPTREISAKDLLMERADHLRREAHSLETLARELPDGHMSPAAASALTGVIVRGLHR